MFSKSVMALTGSATILIAGAAFAAPGGNGSGRGNVSGGMAAPSGPMNSPMGSMQAGPSQIGAGVNANANASASANVTTRAAKSQGPLSASPNGIAHASPNSVLARGQVAASVLPGLTTGLTVNNKAGTSIGTVSRIVTDPSGNIRLVIVTSPTGQMIRLAPNTLSISGNVVTTTSTTVGG